MKIYNRIYLNLHVPESESTEFKLHSKRSKHNYSMLGRWLDRLHENEERVTPIGFIIIRNIGKQVVYIWIKKMSIDLKMAAKAWNRRNQKKNEKAFIRWNHGKSRANLRLLFNPVFQTPLCKLLTNILSIYVNSGHAYDPFWKFLFSHIFFALPVYFNYPGTPQYIRFKQASLAKKVMLWQEASVCLLFRLGWMYHWFPFLWRQFRLPEYRGFIQMLV